MNLNVELENNTMAYELFKKLAVIVDLLPCEKIGGFVGTQKVKLEIIFLLKQYSHDNHSPHDNKSNLKNQIIDPCQL